MTSGAGLSTQSVREVFEEEVSRLGGVLKDVFDDRQWLLARCVLPKEREVGPRDTIQNGVAVRYTVGDLCVHPYTLRRVCTNGAIMIKSSHTWRIESLDIRSPEHILAEVREAITACAADDAFAASAQAMSDSRTDLALNMLAHLSRMPQARRYITEVLARFERDGDPSRFGLMNAATSLARDTKDPKRKWDLESLGGTIAAGLDPAPPPRPLSASRELATSH